jgi:hypothetical protein
MPLAALGRHLLQSREAVAQEIESRLRCAVRRRREPPHPRARPRAWVGAAAQRGAKRRAASCARRPRGRACGRERRLRSARGEGETCSRAERCPPTLRLGRAGTLKVIRSDLYQVAIHERAERAGHAAACRRRPEPRAWAAPRALRVQTEGWAGGGDELAMLERQAGREAAARRLPRAQCRIPFSARCRRRDAARGGRVHARMRNAARVCGRLVVHISPPLARAGAAARPLRALHDHIAQLVACSGRDAARAGGLLLLMKYERASPLALRGTDRNSLNRSQEMGAYMQSRRGVLCAAVE